MVVILKEYGIIPSQVFFGPHDKKLAKIRVFSQVSPEYKQKMQKLQNQVHSLTQIHNKEFKAQEKQYKQLLFQETNEKQEIQDLKSKLSVLVNHYAIFNQNLKNKHGFK